jgi:hypothetical protein
LFLRSQRFHNASPRREIFPGDLLQYSLPAMLYCAAQFSLLCGTVSRSWARAKTK